MLSKNNLKLIQKLLVKKYRDSLKLFIVEGKKSINEFLNEGYNLHSLFCVNNTFNVNSDIVYNISYNELKTISSFDNPDDGLAVFHKKEENPISYEGTIIVLDKIRDPGNLGTIIRISDWFGVSSIVCSTDTVDCYNHKVVQASMGSLSRIPIYYTALDVFLKKSTIPIYATTLQGENIYTSELPKSCIIVMGNEANGVSDEILELSEHRLTIPKEKTSKAESLNVAIATAVIVSHIKK